MPTTIDSNWIGVQRRGLAEALCELGRARGVSEKALAAAVHVSQSAIGRIETGATMPNAADVEFLLCTV